MYDKKSLVLGFALLIVGILCLIQVNREPATDPDAQIALKFIQDSPTFKNYGVLDSIKLIKLTQAMTLIYPSFKIVEVEFDSYLEGYGERDFSFYNYGKVIDHHVVLHVSDGKVTRCIIDGVWDEVAQMPEAFTRLKMYPSTIEEVRDIAVRYSINNYDVTLTFPVRWDSRFTIEDIFDGGDTAGTHVVRYSSGGWLVTVEHSIVARPTYSVEVEYMYKSGGFGWAGTIDSSGKVDVTRTTYFD